MDTKRLLRAAEAYQHELAQILLLNTREPRLLDVTVTHVVFTPDMKLAKIYFAVAGGKVRESEVIKGFEKAVGYIRRELAQRVPLKFAPELRFYYDDTQEERDRMERLFRQIEDSRNEDGKADGKKDSQED